MFKIRFLLGFILVIMLSLSLSGCWDQVGIGERTLIIGIGIDLIPGDEPVLLTAQVINFSSFNINGGLGGNGAGGNSGNQSPVNNSVVVETSQGRTLSEAIHNFLKYSSRQVTFSHNRIVILGNELARSGLAGIFDEMARDYQFRPTNWILATDTTAREILQSRTDLGVIPAYEINSLLTNLNKNALIFPVNLNDFLFQQKNEAKTGLLPLIQVEKTRINPFPRIRIE